jgi:hypothetical protein
VVAGGARARCTSPVACRTLPDMRTRQQIILCDTMGNPLDSGADARQNENAPKQSSTAATSSGERSVFYHALRTAADSKLRLHPAAPSCGHLEELHVGRVRLVRRMARLAHEHLPARGRTGPNAPTALQSPGADVVGVSAVPEQTWPRVKQKSAPPLPCG